MRIFISGSSRGLGKAMAADFLAAGHDVAINGAADRAMLTRTHAELVENGGKITSVFADLSDYEAAKAAFAQIEKELGGVDVLINNAGISYVGLFTDMRPDEWQRLISVNQLAMVNCAHLVIPGMLKNRCGHIINISSIWGEAGASCEAIYSMTKGAANAFTKALAKELAPSNIRVNAIAPGVMDTAMNDFLDEDEKATLIDQIPLGRFGDGTQIARAARFLMECDYITGKILTIDGGLL